MAHQGGRYPGRGSILSQIVIVVEWYSLFAHGSDALSKFLHMIGMMSDDIYRGSTLKGLRGHNLFASLIRIMCHSIFLNVLDESYQLRNASRSSSEQVNGMGNADSGSTAGSTSVEEMSRLVKLT